MPKSSHLERTFLFRWDKAIQGPELAREFAFHPSRKWRFDFAHVESRTAIEIEGGIWTASRHTTGRGFSADCEKYNEASLRGWTVFRLTDAMIDLPTLGRIHHHIHTKRLPCNPPAMTAEGPALNPAGPAAEKATKPSTSKK